MTPRWKRCFVVAFLLVAPGTQAGPFSNLFVIGDSLSDIGNVTVVTGGAVPGVPYFNGRASNGPLYVDVLAQGLGLPLSPSRLDTTGDGVGDGNNFAYGGARTRSYPFPFDGRSLLGQLAEFESRYPVADPDALYVVFGGANNIQDALFAAAGGAPAAVVNAMIEQGVGDIAFILTELAASGAHNFLVPNLPNVALVPRIREFNNPLLSAIGAGLGMAFNAGLDAFLADFGLHEQVWRLDVFDMLQQRVDDPAAFGLVNVTGRCYTGDDIGFTGGPPPCPNPNEYLFWDGIHPTAVVHADLGREALRLVAEPPTALLLVAALVTVAGVARRRLTA
jgi:phospholipase/lecithinase/hemolysin